MKTNKTNLGGAMSLSKGPEVLAFARMTMHFCSNGGDPDFRQDRSETQYIA